MNKTRFISDEKNETETTKIKKKHIQSNQKPEKNRIIKKKGFFLLGDNPRRISCQVRS